MFATFITFETLLVCNVTVVAIFLQKNASLAELSLCLVVRDVSQGRRLVSLQVCWGEHIVTAYNVTTYTFVKEKSPP